MIPQIIKLCGKKVKESGSQRKKECFQSYVSEQIFFENIVNQIPKFQNFFLKGSASFPLLLLYVKDMPQAVLYDANTNSMYQPNKVEVNKTA